MNRNFRRSLAMVLRHEGGFVNHPKDPGGATNKGVTLATYRRYINPQGTVADLKRITDAEVAKVYKEQYWDAVSGDALSDGVDYTVFDFAVNSGPSRAIRHLQMAIGAEPDGKIGPSTIAASRKMDGADIINKICDSRLAFKRRLKTWKTFGKGWSNRVADVRKYALAMLDEQPEPVFKPQPPQPEKKPEPKPNFWQRLRSMFTRN